MLLLKLDEACDRTTQSSQESEKPSSLATLDEKMQVISRIRDAMNMNMMAFGQSRDQNFNARSAASPQQRKW